MLNNGLVTAKANAPANCSATYYDGRQLFTFQLFVHGSTTED